MRIRRARPVALLAAALFVLSACAAITYPVAPTAEERAMVEAAGPHGRCAIGGAASQAERAVFAEALQETGLFDSVVAVVGPGVPPGTDWIIVVGTAPGIEARNGGCPGMPEYFNILTLGIVPIVRERDATREYFFARTEAPGERSRTVSAGGTVTAIDGWVALPLQLLPWWFASSGSSARVRRDAELLAVELCRSGLLDGRGADR
jgi:hypothetical protein